MDYSDKSRRSSPALSFSVSPPGYKRPMKTQQPMFNAAYSNDKYKKAKENKATKVKLEPSTQATHGKASMHIIVKLWSHCCAQLTTYRIEQARTI